MPDGFSATIGKVDSITGDGDVSDHWANHVFDSLEEVSYAEWPHGDNIYVRRMADAEHGLQGIAFADEAIEVERQSLVKRTQTIRATIAETQVSMVVAGSFNAGKSTLINAFLGESWMPMRAVRETVVVSRILDGKDRELRVFYRDGRPYSRQSYRSAQEVYEKIQKLGESEHAAIERIDILYPGHPFLRRCAIIDTPGMDFSQEDDITSQPLIDEADVLLWVMHYEGPRKGDHRALRTFRQRSADSQMLVVVNYADLLDDSEYEETLADKHEKLGQEIDKVFLVSAKRDLTQKGSDPGFNILRAHLNEQILPAYGELKHRRPARLAGDYVNQIHAFVEKARNIPLKASWPYRVSLSGILCWTARELAMDLAKDWKVAIDDLENGYILPWLRDALKDHTLVCELDGLIKDDTLTRDEKLLRILIRMAPDLPPIWKGNSLAIDDLRYLARKAVQDEAARSTIKEIFDLKVLQVFARAGQSQYDDIFNKDFHDALELCEDVLNQWREIIPDMMQNSSSVLLPHLLLVALADQFDMESMAREAEVAYTLLYRMFGSMSWPGVQWVRSDYRPIVKKMLGIFFEDDDTCAIGSAYILTIAAMFKRTLSDAILEKLYTFSKQSSSLFFDDSIPEKKLLNARKFCSVPSDERILVLLDCTVFGSAENSVVFGTRGMYYYYGHTQKGYLPYQDFPNHAFEKKDDFNVRMKHGLADLCVVASGGIKADGMIEILMAISEIVSTDSES